MSQAICRGLPGVPSWLARLAWVEPVERGVPFEDYFERELRHDNRRWHPGPVVVVVFVVVTAMQENCGFICVLAMVGSDVEADRVASTLGVPTLTTSWRMDAR